MFRETIVGRYRGGLGRSSSLGVPEIEIYFVGNRKTRFDGITMKETCNEYVFERSVPGKEKNYDIGW